MQTERTSTTNKKFHVHRRLATEQGPRIIQNSGKLPKDFFGTVPETQKNITKPKIKINTNKLFTISEEVEEKKGRSPISKEEKEIWLRRNHEKFNRDLKNKLGTDKDKVLVNFVTKYNQKSKETERINPEPYKINFAKMLNDNEISQSIHDPENNKPKLSGRNFRTKTSAR